MTRSFGRSFLASAATYFCLVSLIFVLDIGRIAPIPGAQMVEQVIRCETQSCEQAVPQGLPYFSDRVAQRGIETQFLRATLPAPDDEMPEFEMPLALYLPKFAENLDIWINGTALHINTIPQRLWATPLLIPVPETVLPDGPVIIDIALHGVPSEGLDLQPFYFGPRDLLQRPYAWRYFIGPGLAQFGIGIMIIVSGTLLIAWGFRRKDPEYLSLSLTCAVILLPLWHYSFGFLLGGYKIGTILWVYAVAFYVFFQARFLIDIGGVLPARSYRIFGWSLLLGTLALFLLPEEHVYLATMGLHLVTTMPAAFIVVLDMWRYRDRTDGQDMWIFLFSYAVAAAFGFYEVYLHLAPEPIRNLHLFHLAPLMMIPTCLWLFLSRLLRSLRQYEALNASLSRTITEKTNELEDSFAKLAQIKRREAIAEERDRIMLDLHDGIGGQLVSTLAYMESSKAGDAKIRIALQDALRDLALMLDSMENHESLVTLIGMLRTRYEDLLSEHGIEFDWQVHGEPELNRSGPSQSLHMARIVQEAITNVIKHAGADTITVYVDEQEIRISDNGRGFDLEQQALSEHPANGIANMKRRCVSIGAKFKMASSPAGTSISMFLDKKPTAET